jgi:hypothetical protein
MNPIPVVHRMCVMPVLPLLLSNLSRYSRYVAKPYRSVVNTGSVSRTDIKILAYQNLSGSSSLKPIRYRTRSL